MEKNEIKKSEIMVPLLNNFNKISAMNIKLNEVFMKKSKIRTLD